jgi:WD40 repeat protein
LTGNRLHQLAAETEWVYDVEFSPDGQWLATGESDGVYLWNVDRGDLLQQLPSENPEEVVEIAWSPNGETLAIEITEGPPAGNIVFWSLVKDDWDFVLPGFNPKAIPTPTPGLQD